MSRFSKLKMQESTGGAIQSERHNCCLCWRAKYSFTAEHRRRRRRRAELEMLLEISSCINASASASGCRKIRAYTRDSKEVRIAVTVCALSTVDPKLQSIHNGSGMPKPAGLTHSARWLCQAGYVPKCTEKQDTFPRKPHNCNSPEQAKPPVKRDTFPSIPRKPQIARPSQPTKLKFTWLRAT